MSIWLAEFAAIGFEMRSLPGASLSGAPDGIWPAANITMVRRTAATAEEQLNSVSVKLEVPADLVAGYVALAVLLNSSPQLSFHQSPQPEAG